MSFSNKLQKKNASPMPRHPTVPARRVGVCLRYDNPISASRTRTGVSDKSGREEWKGERHEK